MGNETTLEIISTNMCSALPFILVIIAIIWYIYLFITGKNKMLEKFPKYAIKYRFEKKDESDLNVPQKYETRKGKYEKFHWLTFMNLTDAEIPSDYTWQYATPSTNGWKNIPLQLRVKTPITPKGEESPGWYPYFLVENQDLNHFLPESCEPIIWKFEYKSKYYTHCSYEMFNRIEDYWIAEDWDGYYSKGLIAWLLLLGCYFRNGARIQIKKWKKEIKLKGVEQAGGEAPAETPNGMEEGE